MRRTTQEIVIEVLTNAHEPITITNLLYATKTRYAHVKRLVEDLVKRGLVTTIDPGELDRQKGGFLSQIGRWPGKQKLQRTRAYYQVSEKGKELLRLYDQIKILSEA